MYLCVEDLTGVPAIGVAVICYGELRVQATVRDGSNLE